MQQIHITYLNGPDVEKLALTDDELLAAVEASLSAQGRGETVIEPRVHLIPESSAKGTSTCCAAT
jgi:ornithine cyclodeaminase